MSNHRKLFDNLIKPFIHRSADRAAKKEDDLETIAAQEQKLFPYRTLVVATRDFHLQNKLGAGGFGPVYKGKLEDGREIAVKKLSQSSNQGKKEFLNEASLLARLQHKNVVNLLGYCAEGSEKLLVYEYISNESLDKILFHSGKRAELDWKKRFDIITGVARGLVYLHQDAPSRIIHRDIKASNILLDDKWMPKIADFGMARLFAEDQTHVNTRVAGTNGYMAPEYVMHGQLSEKADVFSFGVLVLETISGKKNSTFNADPDAQSLLEWAWKLYKKGRALEMMDPSLGASAVTKQVAMCIHIGLLCVQADPTLRPDMPRVVFIMSRQPSNLEEPTKPPYPGSRYRRSSIRGSSSRASAATSSGHSYTRSCTDSDTTTNTNTTTTTNTNSATTSTNDPPHRDGQIPRYSSRPKTGSFLQSRK